MISAAVKAKALVFGVFFVGALTGALVDNVYETRWNVDADAAPERRSQREVNRVYDFLGLSPEQQRQWKAVMQESRPEFDKLFEENRKLTAPNQPKFDALRAESEQAGTPSQDEERPTRRAG